MRLPKGKVPSEILERTVFQHLGSQNPAVVLGPSVGEDGAIIKVGDKVLVSSVDPITGASKRLGWLALNVCANDVATFGVKPSFFTSCILLPEDSREEDVKAICVQLHKAAKKLDIALIGGHSEVTPGLKRPIIVGHSLGIADGGRYVTSGGARPGNKIILTKTAAVEGTAILASEKGELLEPKFGSSFLRRCERLYQQISVVKEALRAFETGGVTAMHDPTEGGVLGGINEVADASNVGAKVYEEAIQIAPETRKICNFFTIDPLQLVSSGSLLISAAPPFADIIIEALRQEKVEASVIGEFLSSPNERVLIGKDGSESKLDKQAFDQLWTVLEDW